MPKAVKTTSTPAPSRPPAVSLAALGYYLGGLKQLEHRLELLGSEVGSEAKQGGDLTPERLQQRQVRHAELAVARHAEAVEQTILTGRAINLEDATLQIMLAAATLDRMKKHRR